MTPRVLRWALAALAAVLIGAALWGWRERRRADRYEADSARLRADSAVLAARSARLDSVYLRDTVTLREVRTRTTTVLDTLRDTLVRTDTVRVWLERERAACDAALTTCEERVAAERLRTENAEARLKLLQDNPPAPRRWSLGAACGYGGVVAGGTVHVGPGCSAGVGFRVW